MGRGPADNGSINDIPWTAVFDPVANARALSAIQARGFSAASQLVDRFVQAAQPGADGPANARSGAPADSTGAAVGADVDLIVSTWWSMFGRMLRAMPGATRSAGDGAIFDLGSETASGGVHLAADGPGRVSAEVWLHNTGVDDVTSVRLRCGPLLGHDGGKVGAKNIRFSPARFPVPARSSRGITVKVTVPQGLSPGVYRGTLLAQGHPQLWLPVSLTLRPTPG